MAVYSRAVGKQAYLGALMAQGRRRLLAQQGQRLMTRGGNPRAPLSPTMRQYFNAGVNVAYGNTRQAHVQLGDLFNDIMGAVVPGWDQRPEALKAIVVKPNPTTLLQMANKVAPNAAGDIIGAANRNGLDVMVKTKYGLMPMNQAIAQGLYSNAGILAQAQGMFSSIPSMVWIGGGVLGAVYLLMRR